jgi:hypothetical protein
MVTLVGPTLDPRCVEAFPGPAVWKCLWGQYRLPIVSTPFFANVPQFDDFEMQYDMDNLGAFFSSRFSASLTLCARS